MYTTLRHTAGVSWGGGAPEKMSLLKIVTAGLLAHRHKASAFHKQRLSTWAEKKENNYSRKETGFQFPFVSTEDTSLLERINNDAIGIIPVLLWH